MATVATNDPITIKEVLTLPSIGINPQFITFSNVTMESDKFICVIETSPQNRLVIIDMSMPMQPLRMSIKADSALMNPISKILALKGQLPGTTQDYLQIFNIEMKASMKSHQMPDQVAFWKWITPKKLGLVTQTSVYHWSLEGDSEPVKMFDRTANLSNYHIICYKCDPTEKWLVLIGMATGSPERPLLLKGNIQLFSVDQQRSQALEAHAASFATLKVPGNENPSILISFATKILIAGQVTSKLHVIELGAQPGQPSFTRKQADLVFPPDFEDDFPVSMQISHKYGLIYVITNLLLLFVYDLETATAVYRNRISPDPIFLTCEATSVGGFYAVNRRGQVLLATVNESKIVPFVSEQKNNLDLAVSLAKRGTSSYSGSGSASSVIMIDSIGNDEESDLATVNESTIVPFVSEQKNNLELAVSLANRGTSSYSGSASSVIMIDSIGNDKESDPSNSSSVQWSQQCRHFKFSEILLATKNFDESLVIGRGGFGKVYRGTIFNGSTTVIAAIKRLDSSSNQGTPEFWAEVEILSKLRHCHLVSLFGYCNPEKEMILVYEYMPNGTLEDHLHKIGTPLSWLQRLKICIGAGRGLHYLHTGTGIDVGVIHRDVKTSNILLQESWAAKISDFGLSKISPTNQPLTHVNTLVKGTFGYFDPDYYATGKLTRKSDVYAFGVVLLEVLCRKRAVFDIDEEAFNLAIWAQESIKKGNLKNIIDPDLRGQISSKSLKEFVRITKRCLHSSPKQRPTMAEALVSLESILDLQEKFNN